jgi:PIN domain nuclease of toxin-antitoxin system
MKYLLDTHTAIWALADDAKLSRTAKAAIADISNSLCISIASAWELAIKTSLGKIDFSGGVAAFLNEIEESGIGILGIDGSYVECIESLPFIHRDPFDRILVATAISENIAIITLDENIRKYDVDCHW